VDADAVYHGLLQPVAGTPSPLAARIGAAFPGVLRPDGHVDRARLGQQVFGDAEARRRLEALTHPEVSQGVQVALGEMAAAGRTHALYDVPLLYEKNLQAAFRGVAVVWVPRETQLVRLMARDRLDEATALARIGAQGSLDDKRAQARWAIDNTGDLAATEAQVRRVWEEMQLEG
jgi:dephospho-CoA kinase